VIFLDNVSVHIDNRAVELIESQGHLVQFLPPNSPDYNPIGLTFGTLEVWIRRNYFHLRQGFGSFGNFLEVTTELSRCDRLQDSNSIMQLGGVY
jgi:transposase